MHATTMRATTTIRSPPFVNDYVSLEQYQAQTPASFAVGRAILHSHIEGATASIPESQRGSLALFPADMAATGQSTLEQKVDLFVNSENLTIFSSAAEVGVSIPYPSISIHAVKQVDGKHVIWMQLELNDGGANDDDFTTVELTIFPASVDSHDPSLQELYEAISACSNLHPNPNDDDSDEEKDHDGIIFDMGAEHEPLDGFIGVLRGTDDGSLPPPVPGSGGWITADNAHEFFDNEGNWIGHGDDDDAELGEGAGRVRLHAELEPTTNGHGSNGVQDNKRAKVDED